MIKPRGFAAIGLDRIKCNHNLGGVFRAAGVFGASLVVVSGQRIGKFSTDTMKAHRHIPCVEADDLWTQIPYGAQPVVIELVEGARSLDAFIHPESAFYVFGPEDGSVKPQYVKSAAHVVQIPAGCLNVAAAVNVVLYDRIAKQRRK